MARRDRGKNRPPAGLKTGEPYATVRALVRRAEGEFEQRHVANLTVASRTKPRYSAWLLEHAPSTKKAWRDQVNAMIGGDGSTFNLLAVLDGVEQRRKAMPSAAKSAESDPSVIDVTPETER